MERDAKPETAQGSKELRKQLESEEKRTELAQRLDGANQSDVLIISARPDHLKTLIRVLNVFSGRVAVASSLRRAKEALSLQSFALIFCDESLSDGSYHELLSTHIAPNGLKLVLVLRSGEWPEYLEAMRLGAFDALRSPLQSDEVEGVLLRAATSPAPPLKASPNANAEFG